MRLERLVTFLFGFTLCFALTACGSESDDSNTTDPTDASDASTTDDPADPSGDVEETRAQTILALTGDAECGTATYQTNCQGCHGADGDGPVGTNLQGWVMTEESVNAIIDGKGSMPGFGNYFTDQEIADLVAFVETL